METLEKIERRKFQLETLTCPSCIKRIEGVLYKEPGVKKAKVLFNSSKVKIEYDEEIVSSNRLAEVIEKVGFSIIHT